jgi:hypothetical protein
MISISVVTLLGFISIHSVRSQGPTKSGEMNMDSKDMNGMKMEGKDGEMSKADMKK